MQISRIFWYPKAVTQEQADEAAAKAADLAAKAAAEPSESASAAAIEATKQAAEMRDAANDKSGCPHGPNKCKSTKEGERFRFFRGLPPLPPGFAPKEGEATGANTEIKPPDTLPDRAHYVYMVEGEGVPLYECCIIGGLVVGGGKIVPYAWLSQSDEFFQGVEALKRVGFPIEDDLIHDPTDTINHMHAAVQTMSVNFPKVRIVMGIDDGTGMRCSGNDTVLMDKLHEWDRENRAN